MPTQRLITKEVCKQMVEVLVIWHLKRKPLQENQFGKGDVGPQGIECYVYTVKHTDILCDCPARIIVHTCKCLYI